MKIAPAATTQPMMPRPIVFAPPLASSPRVETASKPRKAYAAMTAAAVTAPIDDLVDAVRELHAEDVDGGGDAHRDHQPEPLGYVGELGVEADRRDQPADHRDESSRTDNSPGGAPFGGYGSFWTQDSVARFAKFLNNDHGAVDGTRILDPALLAATMQRTPQDRGMTTTGTKPMKYQNGFWGNEFASADNLAWTSPFYVPFTPG